MEDFQRFQGADLLVCGHRKWQSANHLLVSSKNCILINLQKDKHIVFEDPKATTSDPDGSKYSCQEWMDTIERAKELAISQSMTNSYAGDSAFSDLNSSITSPAATLGGDALDGVNIPTARHLRKNQDDTDSIKGRKRFSKRHSKNGLAAVF
jgi:3-phosphoinositide dependent protein kinase-1